MQTIFYVKMQAYVQVLVNCFLTNCISQLFSVANGFTQNNAENLHSVAKRDARKVIIFYYIGLYFNLYIPQTNLWWQPSFPWRRRHPKTSRLTCLSHQCKVSTKSRSHNDVLSNKNICDIRWAASYADRDVCFFSEFLKALVQVTLMQ